MAPGGGAALSAPPDARCRAARGLAALLAVAALVSAGPPGASAGEPPIECDVFAADVCDAVDVPPVWNPLGCISFDAEPEPCEVGVPCPREAPCPTRFECVGTGGAVPRDACVPTPCRGIPCSIPAPARCESLWHVRGTFHHAGAGTTNALRIVCGTSVIASCAVAGTGSCARTVSIPWWASGDLHCRVAPGTNAFASVARCDAD